ncbi:hypothetical protein HK102_007791 [Quaeritorhiza haematococci]|nr:hypothetical protein HK102_007791 [Quaeritorhiza haematococci]
MYSSTTFFPSIKTRKKYFRRILNLSTNFNYERAHQFGSGGFGKCHYNKTQGADELHTVLANLSKSDANTSFQTSSTSTIEVPHPVTVREIIAKRNAADAAAAEQQRFRQNLISTGPGRSGKVNIYDGGIKSRSLPRNQFSKPDSSAAVVSHESKTVHNSASLSPSASPARPRPHHNQPPLVARQFVAKLAEANALSTFSSKLTSGVRAAKPKSITTSSGDTDKDGGEAARHEADTILGGDSKGSNSLEDQAKLLRLSLKYQSDYEASLRVALGVLNNERRVELRRRKEQDERWEKDRKVPIGEPNNETTSHRFLNDEEIGRIHADRAKVDEMYRQRRRQILEGVRSNFELKLVFAHETREKMASMMESLKDATWDELCASMERTSRLIQDDAPSYVPISTMSSTASSMVGSPEGSPISKSPVSSSPLLVAPDHVIETKYMSGRSYDNESHMASSFEATSPFLPTHSVSGTDYFVERSEPTSSIGTEAHPASDSMGEKFIQGQVSQQSFENIVQKLSANEQVVSDPENVQSAKSFWNETQSTSPVEKDNGMSIQEQTRANFGLGLTEWAMPVDRSLDITRLKVNDKEKEEGSIRGNSIRGNVTSVDDVAEVSRAPPTWVHVEENTSLQSRGGVGVSNVPTQTSEFETQESADGAVVSDAEGRSSKTMEFQECTTGDQQAKAPTHVLTETQNEVNTHIDSNTPKASLQCLEVAATQDSTPAHATPPSSTQFPRTSVTKPAVERLDDSNRPPMSPAKNSAPQETKPPEQVQNNQNTIPEPSTPKILNRSNSILKLKSSLKRSLSFKGNGEGKSSGINRSRNHSIDGLSSNVEHSDKDASISPPKIHRSQDLPTSSSASGSASSGKNSSIHRSFSVSLRKSGSAGFLPGKSIIARSVSLKFGNLKKKEVSVEVLKGPSPPGSNSKLDEKPMVVPLNDVKWGSSSPLAGTTSMASRQPQVQAPSSPLGAGRNASGALPMSPRTRTVRDFRSRLSISVNINLMHNGSVTPDSTFNPNLLPSSTSFGVPSSLLGLLSNEEEFEHPEASNIAFLQSHDKKGINTDTLTSMARGRVNRLHQWLQEWAATELVTLCEEEKIMKPSELWPHLRKPRASTVKKILHKISGGSPSTYKEAHMSCDALFGGNLEDLVAAPNHSLIVKLDDEHRYPIPTLVVRCAEALRRNGIRVQGIFRVTGGWRKVDELKKLVENVNPEVQEEGFPEWAQQHDIATLFKCFFRDLREPLLTDRLFKVFIRAADVKDVNLRLQILRYLVILLPRSHIATFYYVLKLLKEVASNSEHNAMTSSNLAVVFGPNILRRTTPSTVATNGGPNTAGLGGGGAKAPASPLAPRSKRMSFSLVSQSSEPNISSPGRSRVRSQTSSSTGDNLDSNSISEETNSVNSLSTSQSVEKEGQLDFQGSKVRTASSPVVNATTSRATGAAATRAAASPTYAPPSAGNGGDKHGSLKASAKAAKSALKITSATVEIVAFMIDHHEELWKIPDSIATKLQSYQKLKADTSPSHPISTVTSAAESSTGQSPTSTVEGTDTGKGLNEDVGGGEGSEGGRQHGTWIPKFFKRRKSL